MYTNSLGSVPGMDANVARALEETVSVVQDVEHRLQALKLGLSQAIPQIAPALLWRDLNSATIGRPNAVSPLAAQLLQGYPSQVPMGTPFGVQAPFLGVHHGLPHLSGHFPQQLLQQQVPLGFGGIPQNLGIFGGIPPQGVASPFAGFGASFLRGL